jgi:hypothetical protein
MKGTTVALSFFWGTNNSAAMKVQPRLAAPHSPHCLVGILVKEGATRLTVRCGSDDNRRFLLSCLLGKIHCEKGRPKA